VLANHQLHAPPHCITIIIIIIIVTIIIIIGRGWFRSFDHIIDHFLSKGTVVIVGYDVVVHIDIIVTAGVVADVAVDICIVFERRFIRIARRASCLRMSLAVCRV
jgi:hypothetical protein